MILVSYQPEFYLSDAERDIMASTDKTPDNYRQYFRKTLDLKLQAELETLAPCHSLLQDTSATGKATLEGFYDPGLKDGAGGHGRVCAQCKEKDGAAAKRRRPNLPPAQLDLIRESFVTEIPSSPTGRNR